MIYLGILIFLLNASLGLFTIYKSRTFESFVFGIFALCFGLWALSIYMTLITETLFWGRTAFVGAIGGIGSLFIFSFVFPGNRVISKKLLILLLVPVLVLEYFSYSSQMISSVLVKDGSITGTFGPIMNMYKFYAPIYIFGSVYMIFKTYRRSKTYTEKLRIKYALLGIALFVIPAVLTNAILPLWFNIYSLNALVPLFSILLVSFISYAIIKHEFLDIKVIIQRGVIYTALLSVVTATYVGLIFLGEVLLQGSEAVNATLSAFITTLLGIFGVPRLKLYFEKITDPIFFKHRYDYATVLGELTDVLNKTIVLDTIIEKTQYILGQALKMSSLQFYLHGGEKPSLQEHELLFPVMSSKKKVGYIVLGEKRSGDPYTIEDKKLLETFAKQAGIALEKAALYKQVKDYATTLEQKVEERTQEIKNIQRDQESLMLEISHGLQTPLTVMKGELFFLRKQGADQEKIEVLDTSIDRISAFIYRLLNISQLESSLGKEQRELSLSSTLTSLLGFFQEEALRKNIILSGKIDNNITILGNEDEITELFSNLISNSIKYIGQKSEKTIAVEATIHDTVTVVTIKDSGIGMEALEVKKLFQKFSRIKNEYTKNIPGTGLGLAICKKIVEIHKGTIAVTSNLGEGTSIAISLPLYKK